VHIQPAEAAHCFATDAHLFVSLFVGRARTADIAAMHDAAKRHVALEPRYAMLTIVAEQSTIGERGRKRITQMMKDLEPQVEAWAIVIEGRGFWSTTARAITSTIRLLSRSAYPLKVCSTPAEAIAWLAAELRRKAPADLDATIVEMRRQLSKP
jgi:hypothetical protein